MKTKILIPIAIVAFIGLTNSAFSQDSKWQQNHPRREQVNSRLANQNARIDKKVDDGKMSKAEASKLHSEDHAIRKEERSMASKDGGHITKADQNKLNRQENHVSRQIKRH
ncbi:MAG TPA: hypothetical protein VNV85_13965 [Puia sp.]|jgi:hypothetical protein|nr:hypothetical protein [Puia sp.]